jgi:putative endonuclease
MRFVKPAVYILASKRNGTLYIGVTADLASRVSVHQQDLADGFTKRYGVNMLVYYEHFDTMPDAIAREKTLKKFLGAEKDRADRSGQSRVAGSGIGDSIVTRLAHPSSFRPTPG